MADPKNPTKRGEGCGHPMYDFDSHKYCFPCRDKGKGDDLCTTSDNPDDCYCCLAMTSEQKRKLFSKKKKEKSKETPVPSKEIEDNLLSDGNSNAPTPDPLSLIISRLDDMQNKIQLLEKKGTHVVSLSTKNSKNPPSTGISRVQTPTPTPRPSTMARSDDIMDFTTSQDEGEILDSNPEDCSSLTSKKRDRSPSPSEDQGDDYPTYRHTLATIREILELELPEDTHETPSRMFGTRDQRRKPPLPMALPSVDGITQRWVYYEKKTSGNPKKDQPDSLQDNPINANNFLAYPRARLRFYHTPTEEFAVHAPSVQQGFKTLFQKPLPSNVYVPYRQHCLMESVNRENVQVLQFSNWFIRAIEKCSMSLENTLQSIPAELRAQPAFQEIERDLSALQLQFTAINSLDKALDTITDNSIALACNLELARRDSILKTCAPQLSEHDFNRLRRSGFRSKDLFSPTTLNEVEDKYARTPKIQKTDSRPMFSSRRQDDNRQNQRPFRFQQDSNSYNKKSSNSYTSNRGGRGRRK